MAAKFQSISGSGRAPFGFGGNSPQYSAMPWQGGSFNSGDTQRSTSGPQVTIQPHDQFQGLLRQIFYQYNMGGNRVPLEILNRLGFGRD